MFAESIFYPLFWFILFLFIIVISVYHKQMICSNISVKKQNITYNTNQIIFVRSKEPRKMDPIKVHAVILLICTIFVYYLDLFSFGCNVPTHPRALLLTTGGYSNAEKCSKIHNSLNELSFKGRGSRIPEQHKRKT